MKIQQAFSAIALTLVAGASFAAEPAKESQPVSRAEVRQGAIDARKAGETNVGELPNYPASGAKTTGKRIKRAAKRSARTAEASTK